MATRLQHGARSRAANIATTHVYRFNLTQAAFLYIDFTGLRLIPEPKQDIISRYYSLVEKCARRRSATWLYGGQDGDDAYTFLFPNIEPALQCARDIKQEFSENLFLHSNEWDVKFGLSFVAFPEKKREESVLKGWGTAKDCCEYKGNAFRNRGDLIISEETMTELQNKGQIEVLTRFDVIAGEYVKGTQSQIFRFLDIAPLTKLP